MSDTGFKTTGNIASSAWTNFTTTRINTSDNSYATTGSTIFAIATTNNYSFGVPSGATINGIEVSVEFSDGSGGILSTIQISLSWNNGTNYTTAKSDTVTGTTDTTRTYGGAADTWGHSWTDTELANGTFLVKYEGKTNFGQCRLDYTAIKVYYTTSTGSSNFFLLF